MGSQPAIFNNSAGSPAWSPFWNHFTVTWNEGIEPRVIRSGADLRAAIEAEELQIFNDLGFSGTPSFQFIHTASGETLQLVGAQPYDIFSEWIETVAEGGAPVDPQQAQRRQQESDAQIPRWASVEGLRPDPERPGYLWVFKHFPVESTHPQSMEAGIAAECAAYQGKFWEMHDLLFERVSDWSVRDPFPALLALGQDLALDLEAFEACLNDPEIQQDVESDLIEGAQLVRGTPSFVILANEQGRIIPGALPAEQFSQALVQVAAEFGVSLD